MKGHVESKASNVAFVGLSPDTLAWNSACLHFTETTPQVPRAGEPAPLKRDAYSGYVLGLSPLTQQWNQYCLEANRRRL